MIGSNVKERRQRREVPASRKQSRRMSGVLYDMSCGQLFGHDRFLGPLKVAFVRALWPVCPDLAARLDRLSDRQFGRLWEEVRRRAGRGS